MKFWRKSAISLKKRFDIELVCNDKYLKTKIKSYKGKVNTNFHSDKISKEGSFSSISGID